MKVGKWKVGKWKVGKKESWKKNGRKKKKKKGKLEAYAMKRVTAGAHLSTPWLFEPARRPDDRSDYYMGCSFLH